MAAAAAAVVVTTTTGAKRRVLLRIMGDTRESGRASRSSVDRDARAREHTNQYAKTHIFNLRDGGGGGAARFLALIVVVVGKLGEWRWRTWNAKMGDEIALVEFLPKLAKLMLTFIGDGARALGLSLCVAQLVCERFCVKVETLERKLRCLRLVALAAGRDDCRLERLSRRLCKRLLLLEIATLSVERRRLGDEAPFGRTQLVARCSQRHELRDAQLRRC